MNTLSELHAVRITGNDAIEVFKMLMQQLIGFGAGGGRIQESTGGSITTSGGYRIHTFTSSGSFYAEGSGTVEYLVVAGGGGAGSDGSPGTAGSGGTGIVIVRYLL